MNFFKKISCLLLLFICVFVLASCSEETTTTLKADVTDDSGLIVDEHPEELGDGYVDSLPKATAQGTILQAFNWTFNQIAENLDAIADAGFKVVQTSPVQQPKGGGATWWSFYQPLSFSIADNSPLGTKDDLKNLCDEAEERNISIIVDIVFNHLANISDTDLESDGTPKVSPDVAQYEPEIYALRNASGSNATFHHNPKASGVGAVTQVYQYGMLPDLNTANSLVQQRALALLKECIDVGVDGFRFDAAKHIETPDDSQYASDFWPNTLGKAKDYYRQKNNKELFAYGEILNEVGGDRSISSYTKYMCVTDNTYINKVSGAITNADPSQLVSGEYGRNDTSASNLVTWVESHDTYSGKYPVFYEAWHYGIMAARKDSRPMLLAHPDSADDSKTVGIVASYDFESEFFAVTNRFHNRFLGASEAIYAQEQNLIIERYSSTDAGALVINFKKNANVTVSFTNLEDGIYYDQLTGKRVEVKNHQATLQMDKDIALAVLTKTKNQPHPRYSISVRGGAFLTNLNVVVESKYATDAYYTVNGGEHIAIENGYANITLANQTSDVTLAFHFANSQFTIDRTYVYKAVSIKEGGFNIIDLNTSYLTDNELYFWAWSGSTAGKWYKLSEVLYKNDNGTLLVNFPSDKDHFLIGLFAKGYVVTNVNAWDNNCIKQTANIVISDKYFIATGW